MLILFCFWTLTALEDRHQPNQNKTSFIITDPQEDEF